jgi:methionyl-tRNA formyltransferase
MKLVLWIGNDPNQYALAHKLAAQFDVVGIVLEMKSVPSKKKKLTFSMLMSKVLVRLFFKRIPATWFALLDEYRVAYPNLPDTKVFKVNNINDPETKTLTEELSPDLIVVSGTYLVKKNTLSTISTQGIVNLHTGLSPYIKGGPNCTNWCIATQQFELIGNTIMWIDEGIDSGNLILTEQTAFTGTESFLEVHRKVMNHAHDLYAKAIINISNGTAKNVVQSTIAPGTVYYTKDWAWKAHAQLLRNFKHFKTEVNRTRTQPKIVQ